MKANEYFKKHGLSRSKIHLDVMDAENWHNSFYDDLNCLVESHELVEKHGGLESAKKELQRQSILRWINPETERLREAIADVESCQAVKRLEVNQ
ncbi:hypothetical protein AY606_08545 [Acinetobacter sp. SFB]|uniref:hypothetical protein n=1 Tax=Acinetobacter sp. SFB TaxID=1805634 RepID=UPI0007D7C3C9|nr:hypothetical protein [Acinetobacter sp. SFB]OAL78464.1 hypothetical protein AY606_08545 [Acinetobacter sp. SFB]